MKKHHILPAWLAPAAVAALCGYLIWNLVLCQITISTKQQELASVQTQVEEQLAQNAELSRDLADGDAAILERAAREQGYAKPNERVFVDISGK